MQYNCPRCRYRLNWNHDNTANHLCSGRFFNIADGQYPITYLKKFTELDTYQYDSSLQVFNLRAYGAAVNFLRNNLWLQWAIRDGKAKDDYDFSAYVQQLRPTTGTVQYLSFKAGPLIVPPQFATAALSVLDAFDKATASSSKVAIYQLVNTTQIYVKYTLLHKPFVAVLNSGSYYYILTAYLSPL